MRIPAAPDLTGIPAQGPSCDMVLKAARKFIFNLRLDHAEQLGAQEHEDAESLMAWIDQTIRAKN